MNIDTGETIDPIHHITWHEKLMQIRTRKKILQQIFYPTGSLFPKDKTVIPMYVEGIYLNGKSGILIEDSDLAWKTNADEVLLLHQPAPINFSLIFLLAPNDWVTRDILLGSQIEEKNGKETPLFFIRTEANDIGRIKCFENWDMLITTTPYVPALPSLDLRLGNTYRAPNFISPISGLSSILTQAKTKPSLNEEVIRQLYEMRDGPSPTTQKAQ